MAVACALLDVSLLCNMPTVQQYKLLLAYRQEPAVAGCLIASPCMVAGPDEQQGRQRFTWASPTDLTAAATYFYTEWLWLSGLSQGTGMNLRRDIQGMFAYPTLVIFCEGKAGIAAAKALIEATPDSGGLNFPLRQDVRMYYRVSLSPSLSLSLTCTQPAY